MKPFVAYWKGYPVLKAGESRAAQVDVGWDPRPTFSVLYPSAPPVGTLKLRASLAPSRQVGLVVQGPEDGWG